MFFTVIGGTGGSAVAPVVAPVAPQHDVAPMWHTKFRSEKIMNLSGTFD